MTRITINIKTFHDCIYALWRRDSLRIICYFRVIVIVVVLCRVKRKVLHTLLLLADRQSFKPKSPQLESPDTANPEG